MSRGSLVSRFWFVLPVAAAHTCHSDISLGPVAKPASKGLAIDDITLRWCPSKLPSTWPNAEDPTTSFRLFKAWDPMWDEAYRNETWHSIKSLVYKNGAQVLIGTQVTCNETEDDQAWEWTKQFLELLGPEHVLGLAIGNELELLSTMQAPGSPITPECVRDLWDGGSFWRRYHKTVAEFDTLASGFAFLPVTTALGGFALAGNPFREVPGEALVNSFLVNATKTYGARFAFTWNIYPYFDPTMVPDAGTTAQCSHAVDSGTCWQNGGCNVPALARSTRLKMTQLTGRPDAKFWIGETGWSSPMSENIRTPMKPCKAWHALDTMQKFYQGFLDWDLTIGADLEPPSHVFYFTVHDSNSFQFKEHFGLLESCERTVCKLRSSLYDEKLLQEHVPQEVLTNDSAVNSKNDSSVITPTNSSVIVANDSSVIMANGSSVEVPNDSSVIMTNDSFVIMSNDSSVILSDSVSSYVNGPLPSKDDVAIRPYVAGASGRSVLTMMPRVEVVGSAFSLVAVGFGVLRFLLQARIPRTDVIDATDAWPLVDFDPLPPSVHN